MKIEIDLRLLEQNHLSPDDYIFLYIIWRKAFGYIGSIPLRVNTQRLQDDKWIVIDKTGVHEQYIIQDKFLDLRCLYLSDISKYLISAKPSSKYSNFKAKKFIQTSS